MYPLKLRAWDIKSQKMRSVVSIQLTVNGNRSKNGIKFVTMVGGITRTGENVEVMQYTGKQDAAGTDIYSDDILDYFTLRKIVGWNSETAQWSLKSNKDENAKFVVQLATVDLLKSRVVGNIFENSNLINK